MLRSLVNALVPLKVKSKGEENSGDDEEVNDDEDDTSWRNTVMSHFFNRRTCYFTGRTLLESYEARKPIASTALHKTV
jgi:hypothetical protein